MIEPAGTRRLRPATEHMFRVSDQTAFHVDPDLRRVNKPVGRQKIPEVDRALTFMGTQMNIRCLFTTPQLLKGLYEKFCLSRPCCLRATPMPAIPANANKNAASFGGSTVNRKDGAVEGRVKNCMKN